MGNAAIRIFPRILEGRVVYNVMPDKGCDF
jgi:hypothetical protein